LQESINRDIHIPEIRLTFIEFYLNVLFSDKALCANIEINP
jgi:hypothetical protein